MKRIKLFIRRGAIQAVSIVITMVIVPTAYEFYRSLVVTIHFFPDDMISMRTFAIVTACGVSAWIHESFLVKEKV